MLTKLKGTVLAEGYSDALNHQGHSTLCMVSGSTIGVLADLSLSSIAHYIMSLCVSTLFKSNWAAVIDMEYSWSLMVTQLTI